MQKSKTKPLVNFVSVALTQGQQQHLLGGCCVQPTPIKPPPPPPNNKVDQKVG